MQQSDTCTHLQRLYAKLKVVDFKFLVQLATSYTQTDYSSLKGSMNCKFKTHPTETLLIIVYKQSLSFSYILFASFMLRQAQGFEKAVLFSSVLCCVEQCRRENSPSSTERHEKDCRVKAPPKTSSPTKHRELKRNLHSHVRHVMWQYILSCSRCLVLISKC